MASVICYRMDVVEMAIGRFNMIGVMPFIWQHLIHIIDRVTSHAINTLSNPLESNTDFSAECNVWMISRWVNSLK